MRRQCQEPLGLVFQPDLHRRVEGVDIGPVMVGLSADFVQRDQPVPSIEDGILDRLGHHRAGGLLEAAGKVECAGHGRAILEVELQEPADEGDGLVRFHLAGRLHPCHRAIDDLDVLGRNAVDTGIGPVDRQGRRDLEDGALQRIGPEVAGGKAKPGDRKGYVSQHRQFARQIVAEDIALLLVDLRFQRRLAADEGIVCLGHLRFLSGIDVKAGDGGDEFVAGRALDVPAASQAFRPGQDLLDMDHGLAGPGPVQHGSEVAEIALRIGHPIHMVDADAVEPPLARQPRYGAMTRGRRVVLPAGRR